jgi:hypothetical protein
MTDEEFFTEMSMRLVLDRLFNLAVSRTLAHRENKNVTQPEEEGRDGNTHASHAERDAADLH